MASFASAQENNTTQDTTSTGYSMGPVKFANPNSIVQKYTYDPILDRYIYTEQIGTFNIKYPLVLTPKEFQRLVLQESMRDYYQQKIDAQAGQKEGSEEDRKNLLPDFYVNSGFFETIFGSDVISIIPQGSVEVDLGVLYSRQDNPALSPRNRSNFTFDFDQRISVSLLGKIGTRLQITANYDTQSTFDFQNLVKLEYTPTEDDIVQKIEVGNVNMPLNSTLVTGAQSLFGVKTKLQFGKTTVTAVFSEQQSQSRQVTAQGGGTLEEFEFFARDYDENRHFFLSQYFRENYDSALLTYPYVQNRGLQITRVEVWVTNRNNQTQNVRNIVALQDIGESDRIGLPNAPPGFVNVPPGSFPDNANNDFNPERLGEAGNLLTEQVRDITNVESGILVPVNEGFDYGKIETARKLNQGSDYVLNSELGYISLSQRMATRMTTMKRRRGLKTVARRRRERKERRRRKTARRAMRKTTRRMTRRAKPSQSPSQSPSQGSRRSPSSVYKGSAILSCTSHISLMRTPSSTMTITGEKPRPPSLGYTPYVLPMHLAALARTPGSLRKPS